MCGIFGYIGPKNNAGDLILTGLKTLEYRGYDSWGIAVKDRNQKIKIEKHIGKIGNAQLPKIDTYMGIGHTRWATHGNVTDENAHPHLSCDQKVVVVHNGIVENFAQLKKDLTEKHTFQSQTDTEIIAHLIEEQMHSTADIKQVMIQIFAKLEGMNAVVAFFPEQKKIFAIKNGSPLVAGKNATSELVIASDASAIIPYTQQVVFLEDYQLLEMNDQQLTLYSTDLHELSIQYNTLNYSSKSAQIGSYPHFMLKEIHEQPQVLQNILLTKLPELQKAAQLIRQSYGTYLIGCGTAYYACLAGTYLFSKIAHRHLNASTASEFSYLENFLTEKSLIVALSQSGETIDIISTLKKTQKKHVQILAITNTLGSTLFRMSNTQLLIEAGPEKAVCSTKAYTAKIALLYLLAHCLNDSLDLAVQEMTKAIQIVQQLVMHEEYLTQLANTLKDQQHIFILGRGLSYATALEAALKIKEVSYIHAEGFAAGELKHGVIALIDQNTPVIIYNPNDETYADTLAAAYEVKARGARVIGIAAQPHDIYDDYIEVPDCGNASIIPNVVVAQLIGYYLAVAKKLDPDKPRNLAKSVTVK